MAVPACGITFVAIGDPRPAASAVVFHKSAATILGIELFGLQLGDPRLQPRDLLVLGGLGVLGTVFGDALGTGHCAGADASADESGFDLEHVDDIGYGIRAELWESDATPVQA
jgi:hypothetical protein